MTIIALSAVIGAFLSSLLSCIPGLHVYNVLAIIASLSFCIPGASDSLPPEVIIPFCAGMITAFSIVNSIPSVFLSAPDESAFFTILPGQKYVMEGRGYEGVMLTAAGALAGLIVMVVAVAPLAPLILPPAWEVSRPHTHWVVWCVTAFMILSEWPKGGNMGQAGWERFNESWRTTGAGLVTFLLSGLLGFVLIFKSPVSPSSAFQNLMPAFAGLFTLPWLILNIACSTSPPPQDKSTLILHPAEAIHGTAAGTLGGWFAAFFPVITGGIGGMLAGHATAIRNSRAFLVSQGTSKTVYYAGGLMLLFVPGLNVARGGGAHLLKTMQAAGGTCHDYYMVLASIAIGGLVSFLLIGPLTRGTISLTEKYGYRRISILSLVFIMILVVSATGLPGAVIAVTGAGIGLIPVLCGSRRINCLGVILLPMACNMSGFGPSVAAFLGLL